MYIAHLFLIHEYHLVPLELGDPRRLGEPQPHPHPDVRDRDDDQRQDVLHDRQHEVVRVEGRQRAVEEGVGRIVVAILVVDQVVLL